MDHFSIIVFADNSPGWKWQEDFHNAMKKSQTPTRSTSTLGKYEEIYLKEHATIPVLYAGLERWFGRYNHWRPHQTHGNLTPADIYQIGPGLPQDAPGTPVGQAA